MTDIVETPAAPVVPPFPALGSSNFNEEAYAAGSALPGLSAGIHAIGVAAHANATVAKEARDAAVPAAAQAVEARDAAVPAAAQAVEARDAAVPAASAAVDAAQRAEQAAANIQDGPVVSVSVRGGAPRTGVVQLTDEDLNTAWTAIPGKPAVMAVGGTQAEARAAIGIMADDAQPGDFRISATKLDSLKWLLVGANYLRSAYPTTADKLLASFPDQYAGKLQATSVAAAAFSKDGSKVVTVDSSGKVRLNNAVSGNISEIPLTYSVSVYPALTTTDIVFSADGNYFLLSICSAYWDSETGVSSWNNGLFLFKNSTGSWGKIWSTSWATNDDIRSTMSPDAKTIIVCHTGVVTNATLPYKVNLFAHNTTNNTVAAVQNVPDLSSSLPASSLTKVDFSRDGAYILFGLVRSASVVDDFPGYGLYKCNAQNSYTKLPGLSFYAAQAVSVSLVAFSTSENEVLLLGRFGPSSTSWTRILAFADLIATEASPPPPSTYVGFPAVVQWTLAGIYIYGGGNFNYSKRNVHSGVFVTVSYSYSESTLKTWYAPNGRSSLDQNGNTYVLSPTFTVPGPFTYASNPVGTSPNYVCYLRSWD